MVRSRGEHRTVWHARHPPAVVGQDDLTRSDSVEHQLAHLRRCRGG